MAEFINLIPDQELNIQKQDKAIKMSSVVTVLLLLSVLGIAGYYYYETDKLNQEINSTNMRIENQRQQITALSSTEIIARNLFKKFSSLKDIYTKRNKYSIVLDEFFKRTTQGIKIDDFSVDPSGKVTITGSGDNYLIVAKFMKDITDSEYPTATTQYKNLFKTVTLNSVNLENAENRASFSLVVDYDASLIKN